MRDGLQSEEQRSPEGPRPGQQMEGLPRAKGPGRLGPPGSPRARTSVTALLVLCSQRVSSGEAGRQNWPVSATFWKSEIILESFKKMFCAKLFVVELSIYVIG